MNKELLQKIRSTGDGLAVELAQDLYLFRLPKFHFRHGQSYALIFGREMILIDAVHEITQPAVTRLMDLYRPAGMILTHSDLIGQAFGSMEEVSDWINAKVYAHPDDHQGQALEDIMKAEDFLSSYSLSVQHVPGHTPGSVIIYSETKKRLFTGDCAVGNNYDKEETDFTHPPIEGDLWKKFHDGWESFDQEVKEIYPLHGKPATNVNFAAIRESLMDKEHVMR